MLMASTTNLCYPSTNFQEVITFSSLPPLSPPPPSSPSLLSPLDNTPVHPLTLQLACQTVPIIKKDNNEDSEINYDGTDNSGDNKETQPLHPPISFIPNIPDSLLFYPIYVKNTAYRRPCQDHDFTSGCEHRVILAPFIKYSTDYTHVFGTLGEDQEVWWLVVQVGKRVRFPQRITTAKWKTFGGR